MDLSQCDGNKNVCALENLSLADVSAEMENPLYSYATPSHPIVLNFSTNLEASAPETVALGNFVPTSPISCQRVQMLL